MNHHLTQQDAEWIANEGEFAITGWNGDAWKGRGVEEDFRTNLIRRFEKRIGSVKAAAEYFEVSTTTWRAWRCGDRLPPAAVCFHIQKARIGF